MARPTKLTPDTRTRITQAIALGATYELAAQYGGISHDTFSNWMNRGKTELDRVANARKEIEIREIEQPFVVFFEAVKAAEGEAVVGWLAKIEKAATDGSWQAAAWKLERRYPREYGRTVQEVTGKDGGAIEVNYTYPDDNH